eukprot:12103963-Alexandrium_andersonii.AAC.1
MGLRRRDWGGVFAPAKQGTPGKVGVAVIAQEPAVVVSSRVVERGGGQFVSAHIEGLPCPFCLVA